MNTEVKVYPSTDFTGNYPDVIVRTGKALDLKEPEKIVIVGNIEAIGAFLAQRHAQHVTENASSLTKGKGLQFVDPEKAIVLVDKEKCTIVLQLDPENFYGATITGKLEESRELGIFKINTAHEWTREDLIKLFRFNRILFPDPVKCDDLVKSFQKFSAKAYVETVQENDSRGNVAASVNKKVETGIPESFVLELPIYKGQPKVKFEVSICLDVIGTRAAFWFESVQLAELLETQKEEIFNAQLELCKSFPIIHK